MNKLYLKSNIQDCRSITANLINEVDKEISNKEYFLTQMNELGYEEKYIDVLVKYFNQYEVDINLQTTDVNVIDNIIVYEDNLPIDPPEEILMEVNNDINNVLQGLN